MRPGLIIGALALCAALSLANAQPQGTSPSLKQALSALKVPPTWFETTAVQWDTTKPWKDARLEIRRLLALDETSIRQAVKLTWLYAQKGDIGDGHELPMYLFMSGNYAWAVREYPPYIEKVAGKGPTHAYLSYASCLEHFGEYDRALEILYRATNDLQPKPWRISSLAGVESHLGDHYAKRGNLEGAKKHYAEAIRLYPLSDQPYGRHMLHRHAAKVQAKLDLLAMQSLANTPLREGSYTGRALGYSDAKDMEVTVTVAGGKIADVKVKHQEKIELGATRIIPERIVAQQSLQVDGITGATVTCQAIVEGAFQALKQAGLK